MDDIISGGPVEALIVTQMERAAACLATTALVLSLGETASEGTAISRWHAQCGIGLTADEIRTLSVRAERMDHPIVRAAAAYMPLRGAPSAEAGTGLLAQRYWCALPAGISLDTGVTRAVLLCLSTEPITDEQALEVKHLAWTISAVLAGAEAALRQRRESDQLAMLMSYAANPIILSNARSIISMNGPALHLFDSNTVIGGDSVDEQRNIVLHNMTIFSNFLSEVDQDPSTIHTGEIALSDPLTQEHVIMAVACTHVPSEAGDEHSTISVLHDMTRARELEHHRIRQQLFESEKMAATGRLAASIAHEINNPLEAIKNSIYLLVRQTAADDPNRQFLELAQRETERVSRIIRQMLGVARPSVAFSATGVNEVVQEALQLLGPQLRQDGIEANVQLAPDLPLVNASADQLKQVFLNLFLNAKESMQHGGELLVQTRIAHEGDAEFLAGRHVIVRIRDDGGGIPQEILPHVFEPFFSTKSERQGTGLGLWVCQDIIQNHGGQILVRSMVGKGTTFLVALPFIATSPSIEDGITA